LLEYKVKCDCPDLSGASGSGKTTLAQFATGCWGDPTRHPLRIESGRTTPAGIFQTLEALGGLPALVDEAHTVPEPKRLEMACYGFANGQRYTTGGVDGKARRRHAHRDAAARRRGTAGVQARRLAAAGAVGGRRRLAPARR
jgi:uncharacterized protein (DUF927 family)